MKTATVKPSMFFLPLVLCAILCCVLWVFTLSATSVFIQEKSQQVHMENLLLSDAGNTETIT